MSYSSIAISYDASVNEMKTALEGIKTIDEVTVTREEVPMSTVAPISRHGFLWNVTFTSVRQSGDIPSMLVSTDGGMKFYTHAVVALVEMGLQGRLHQFV